MGTMEIESALVANPIVTETDVVDRPDEITGEAICAFVVLKHIHPNGDEAKQIATQLRDWVAKEIRFGYNLPKIRSGKIMRRLLCVLTKGRKAPRICRHLKIQKSWNNSRKRNKAIDRLHVDGSCPLNSQFSYQIHE